MRQTEAYANHLRHLSCTLRDPPTEVAGKNKDDHTMNRTSLIKTEYRVGTQLKAYK